MASGFSSILKLTDLDDFITPSQECIKPPTVKVPKQSQKGMIQVEVASNSSTAQPQNTEKVKITLNDCLACSGCITSAEVVLVSQQSLDQLFKVLKSNKDCAKEDVITIVLSLSPQSLLSLSAKYGLSPQDTTLKVAGYFKNLGVHYVFDTNLARCFSLLEAQNEFIERYNRKQTDNQSLPMLASACPGWVCYAEKTHGSYILPYLSTTRSPQQVMGSLVKKYWAQKLNISPEKVFHVTLMPCFDKKLEASRDHFFLEQFDTREVDCVVTTVEVEEMLQQGGIDFKNVADGSLNSELGLSSCLSTQGGSGSGGYAHHVFINAALKIFGVQHDELNWKTLRNNDFQELVLELDGEVKLRFALAYGFRNIQNLVQKIKRKKCIYDYVEVMACPSGCLNGGAQVRPTNGQTNKELISILNTAYHELPNVTINNVKVKEIYSEWLNGIGSDSVKENLHTAYKAIEKNSNAFGIKW